MTIVGIALKHRTFEKTGISCAASRDNRACKDSIARRYSIGQQKKTFLKSEASGKRADGERE